MKKQENIKISKYISKQENIKIGKQGRQKGGKQMKKMFNKKHLLIKIFYDKKSTNNNNIKK